MEENGSHTNVSEEKNNSSSNSENTELLEIKPIGEDGIFTAIKMEDAWFLAMGKYRLTEPLASEEACIQQATDASWLRLMQVINICIKESAEVTDLQRQMKQVITQAQI